MTAFTYEEMLVAFWEKLEIRERGACWPWIGAVDGNGYGAFAPGRTLLGTGTASRIVWMLTRGAIPPGIFVLHSCDYPPCCNWLDCLFLGTPADNAQDAARKGRLGKGNGNHQYWERDPNGYWISVERKSA